MKRTIVITGAASGIGKAAAELAEARGWQPIRVDLREGDIRADLGTPQGRATMIEGVTRLGGGKLDGVIACAGLSQHPGDAIIRVNFFGAVASLAGLLPLLVQGNQPRAVATTSFAVMMPANQELVEACLREDETAALDIARADVSPGALYPASKLALTRWIRRHAIKPEWAGAGVLLNGVAPGYVKTPMMQDYTDDPARRAQLAQFMPMPTGHDAEPAEMAQVLLWLASPENSTIAGQIIFADGGAEALMRGENHW